VILLVAVFVIQFGVNWLVQRPRVSARLTARLQSAFGRPVEVGQYEFTLWTGPELSADSVVVSEDPRFGDEYFLRAESVTLRPRFVPLLRGRIALSALSFNHPSLNVVVNREGQWNLLEWLPRGGGEQASSPGAPSFSRMKLDSGRINFKIGVLKLPFALIDVDGYIERETSGRWRIDLKAQPMRAATLLQSVGTVRFQGTVGGTTARLRPADLHVAWQDGSLADLLRLTRGDDMGMRGNFSLAFSARAERSQWELATQAQFRRLHRWDLPLRADDPGCNLTARGSWLPGSGNLQLTDFRMEAPRSNARALGSFTWSMPGESGALLANSDFSLDATIGTEDALVFLSAFHPGVTGELSAQGELNAHLHAAAWPPRFKEGQFATEGIRLEGGSLSAPLRLGPARLALVDGQWSLPQTDLVFEPNAGFFSVAIASLQPRAGRRTRTSLRNPAPPSLQLSGGVDDARRIFALAAALGYSLPRGWEVTGPAAADLQWHAAATRPLMLRPSGTLTLDGVNVRAPFLAAPLGPIAAQLDLSSQGELLHLRRAAAFGSIWTGELSHSPGGNGWRGPVSAQTVDLAGFDRALNPSRRKSLLENILPFLGPTQEAAAVPDGLRWSGELAVASLQAGNLHLSRLRADAELNGRTIVLKDVEAALWGGSVAGTFSAQLNSQPRYQSDLNFHRVDLGQLAAPSLQRHFGGLAEGTLKISASGLNKAALSGSLKCEGNASVGNLELNFISLPQSPADVKLRGGSSRFVRANTDFACSDGQIRFTQLQLFDRRTEITGVGTADFVRNLNFRLDEAELPSSIASDATTTVEPGVKFVLSGTLDAPELHSIPAAPKR
jgi:hypothetical protein